MWKSNLSLYTEGTGVESWLSSSFIATVLLSHSLFIKGAGLFSAACPENGLHGGRDLSPTFVFSPTLSVVILALALNGRGFIPAWGGGPLELVVSTPCWAAVGALWMLTWIINNGDKTDWSPVQSVMIRVINKIRQWSRGSLIEYDYRQNWTPFSPATD